jgi:hypothetical protein
MSRFFDEQATFVKLAVLLGIPGLMLSASLRGCANVRTSSNSLANSHVVFATTLLMGPILLYVVGLSLLRSILLGNIIAWGSPGIYLLVARVWRKPTITETRNTLTHLSTWLILTNLLLLALLLSSQLLFKLQSDWMSADTIADAQLLISLSCLSSTLSLGLLPYFVARTREATLKTFFSWLTTRLVLLAGLVVPVFTALLYRPVISLFFDRSPELTTSAAWLISMSATPLVLTVLALAYLIAHEHVETATWCCGIALTSLWLAPLTIPTTSIQTFGLGVFLGSMIGPISLLLANRVSSLSESTAGTLR